MSYGQAVFGMPNGVFCAQRKAVAACLVKTTGGGDLDMTLVLADCDVRGRTDPAFAAHSDPIGARAHAIWAAWLP